MSIETELGRHVLEKEMGTIIVGKRALVFMPRWFYCVALVGVFVFGIALGKFGL